MDACETLPMFEDNVSGTSPKDSMVFTSGSNSSDAPMDSIANGDHAGGNEHEPVASPQPHVKKPRELPPVPVFEPSKPDESHVP